jgi:hypothetical protein
MTDGEVKVDGFVEGAATTYDLSLFSDSSDSPGTDLGLVGSDSAVYSADGATTIQTIDSPALTLLSGVQYWLVMTPVGTSDTFVAWVGGGSTTQPGQLTSSADGSGGWFQPTTSVFLQFQIDGTATLAPEPSTLALAAASMAALALLRKISSRA